jgi:hypothetical protein
MKRLPSVVHPGGGMSGKYPTCISHVHNFLPMQKAACCWARAPERALQQAAFAENEKPSVVSR